MLKYIRFLYAFFLWSTIYASVFQVKAQEYVVVPADKVEYYKHHSDITHAGVRYKTDWTYIISDGNVTTDKYKERIHKFDTQGRLVETTYLDRRGNKESIALYSYRSDGLPLEYTTYSPMGELLRKRTYTYDTLGHLNEVVFYSGDIYIISKIRFEVDIGKRCVFQRNLFSPDSVASKTVYYYSDLNSGFLKEIWEYRGEDDLLHKIHITYLDNAKIETEEWLDARDKILYYVKYDYNPKGWLTSKKRLYTSGRRIKMADFNYTPKGLILGEIVYNRNGEIVRYSKYSYN
jgi:hypothetical protein